MIIEKRKKYLFNAEQAPYFENIHGFVFSFLTKKRKKHLQSDFFKNTPYAYGICIQVDEKKLAPHCQVSLIHEALSSLENNPKQFELVETLCAYLKVNPKKVKKSIDSNFFQEIGQNIGGVIGGIGSIYVFTILFSLVPIGMTLPVILTIVLSLIVFSVVIIGLTCGIGGFLGNHVAKYLNQNHVQPNFEKKLEQLIHENTASVSISKQPIEETDKPQLSNESNISSLFFFPQTKFLGRREDIEKIPTYRNSL